MPKGRTADLFLVDGRFLDGLLFCKRVFDLFDGIKREPAGVSKIRRRAAKREKRLLEELLPLAKYVLSRYRLGFRFKVRWQSGTQPYDAELRYYKPVDNFLRLRRRYVEITTAAHQNDYLAREMLDLQGYSYSARELHRDPATGIATLQEAALSVGDKITNLADQVVARIQSKAAKKYPEGTLLIVHCILDGIFSDSEWADVKKRVADTRVQEAFDEVFLVADTLLHTATFNNDEE